MKKKSLSSKRSKPVKERIVENLHKELSKCCHICFRLFNDENSYIQCYKCNTGVHKICIGLNSVKKSINNKYLCDVCEENPSNLKCIICSNDNEYCKAFRHLKNADKWVHVICGLVSPRINVINYENIELELNNEISDSQNQNNKCFVCKQNSNINDILQCTDCQRKAHIICILIENNYNLEKPELLWKAQFFCNENNYFFIKNTKTLRKKIHLQLNLMFPSLENDVNNFSNSFLNEILKDQKKSIFSPKIHMIDRGGSFVFTCNDHEIPSCYCKKEDGIDESMICCDFCDNWIHYSCSDIDYPENIDKTANFYCKFCIKWKENKNNFLQKPFSELEKFLNYNKINPPFNEIIELSQIIEKKMEKKIESQIEILYILRLISKIPLSFTFSNENSIMNLAYKIFLKNWINENRLSSCLDNNDLFNNQKLMKNSIIVEKLKKVISNTAFNDFNQENKDELINIFDNYKIILEIQNEIQLILNSKKQEKIISKLKEKIENNAFFNNSKEKILIDKIYNKQNSIKKEIFSKYNQIYLDKKQFFENEILNWKIEFKNLQNSEEKAEILSKIKEKTKNFLLNFPTKSELTKLNSYLILNDIILNSNEEKSLDELIINYEKLLNYELKLGTKMKINNFVKFFYLDQKIWELKYNYFNNLHSNFKISNYVFSNKQILIYNIFDFLIKNVSIRGLPMIQYNENSLFSILNLEYLEKLIKNGNLINKNTNYLNNQIEFLQRLFLKANGLKIILEKNLKEKTEQNIILTDDFLKIFNEINLYFYSLELYQKIGQNEEFSTMKTNKIKEILNIIQNFYFYKEITYGQLEKIAIFWQKNNLIQFNSFENDVFCVLVKFYRFIKKVCEILKIIIEFNEKFDTIFFLKLIQNIKLLEKIILIKKITIPEESNVYPIQFNNFLKELRIEYILNQFSLKNIDYLKFYDILKEFEYLERDPNFIKLHPELFEFKELKDQFTNLISEQKILMDMFKHNEILSYEKILEIEKKNKEIIFKCEKFEINWDFILKNSLEIDYCIIACKKAKQLLDLEATKQREIDSKAFEILIEFNKFWDLSKNMPFFNDINQYIERIINFKKEFDFFIKAFDKKEILFKNKIFKQSKDIFYDENNNIFGEKVLYDAKFYEKSEFEIPSYNKMINLLNFISTIKINLKKEKEELLKYKKNGEFFGKSIEKLIIEYPANRIVSDIIIQIIIEISKMKSRFITDKYLIVNNFDSLRKYECLCWGNSLLKRLFCYFPSLNTNKEKFDNHIDIICENEENFQIFNGISLFYYISEEIQKYDIEIYDKLQKNINYIIDEKEKLNNIRIIFNKNIIEDLENFDKAFSFFSFNDLKISYKNYREHKIFCITSSDLKKIKKEISETGIYDYEFFEFICNLIEIDNENIIFLKKLANKEENNKIIFENIEEFHASIEKIIKTMINYIRIDDEIILNLLIISKTLIKQKNFLLKRPNEPNFILLEEYLKMLPFIFNDLQTLIDLKTNDSDIIDNCNAFLNPDDLNKTDITNNNENNYLTKKKNIKIPCKNSLAAWKFTKDWERSVKEVKFKFLEKFKINKKLIRKIKEKIIKKIYLNNIKNNKNKKIEKFINFKEIQSLANISKNKLILKINENINEIFKKGKNSNKKLINLPKPFNFIAFGNEFEEGSGIKKNIIRKKILKINRQKKIRKYIFFGLSKIFYDIDFNFENLIQFFNENVEKIKEIKSFINEFDEKNDYMNSMISSMEFGLDD